MFVHDKNYRKVRNHCCYTGEYRAAEYSLCNLRYSTPKENHVVIQNIQKFDYRFIVKELAKEFEVSLTVYEKIQKNAKPFQLMTQDVKWIDKKWKSVYKDHIL